MMKKIVVIGVLFFMLSGTTCTFSLDDSSKTKIDRISIAKNHVIIEVAILDSVIPSFASPSEMEKILNGYAWSSRNSSYGFETRFVTDMQISMGALDGCDLILIPGIGKEFRRPVDNSWLLRWKNEVKAFVSNGGGYLGTCGGANIASQGLVSASERGWTGETAWEWFMNKSAIGIVPVRAYQDMGDPMACSIIQKNPARIGQSAYVWYNLSIEGSGVCQHCRINREHPIFRGYKYDTRIIRWVGGPALIPDGNNVTILAWYPDENISRPNGNRSTSIHAWRYNFDPMEPFDLWDMESKLIETHLAGKPAAIACEYGKGRVVIFGNHPEHPVWSGGRIVEKDTCSNSMLFKGLFQWEERQSLLPSFNWWIVRRSVAWAAGVPAEELPPMSPFCNKFY
ncbi:MAG: hypothetical protein U9O96_06600 [Candidatus Thermoplasmatota archaeon]|nr:hypothetical protein [Candidatus Thermoplasmatota archaeon]